MVTDEAIRSAYVLKGRLVKFTYAYASESVRLVEGRLERLTLSQGEYVIRVWQITKEGDLIYKDFLLCMCNFRDDFNLQGY